MVTTRSHSETIKKDLQESTEFRMLLLAETVKCLTSGDLPTGKIVLREYINGTIGFVALGAALGKSPKSLMRMLGPQGNPTARNLFDIIAHLQKVEGGYFQIQFVRGSEADADLDASESTAQSVSQGAMQQSQAAAAESHEMR